MYYTHYVQANKKKRCRGCYHFSYFACFSVTVGINFHFNLAVLRKESKEQWCKITFLMSVTAKILFYRFKSPVRSVSLSSTNSWWVLRKENCLYSLGLTHTIYFRWRHTFRKKPKHGSPAVWLLSVVWLLCFILCK